MARYFNPPPGWPPAPPGWLPPRDWSPDPSWPPAPPGWVFWVEAPQNTPQSFPPTTRPDIPPTTRPDIPPTTRPDIPPSALPNIWPSARPNVAPSAQPKKRRRLGAGSIAAIVVVGLLGIGAIGHALGSDKTDGTAVGIGTSASPSADDETVGLGALPDTTRPPATHKPKPTRTTAKAAARTSTPTSAPTPPPTTPTTHKPAPVEPVATTTHKAKPKPKPPVQTETPTPPAHRIVTPGAFCADSELGDIGYSVKGNRYRCSYYPSSHRNRWKRA